MRDLDLLTRAVSRALAAGRTSAASVLSGYWQSRREDQDRLAHLLPGPALLEPSRPLVVGRNLALSLMGRVPWLQAPLASRTWDSSPTCVANEVRPPAADSTYLKRDARGRASADPGDQPRRT